MMKTLYRALLSMAIGAGIAPLAAADVSLSQLVIECKQQAQASYGSAGEAAHLRLVDVLGSGRLGAKRIKLRVVPPAGDAFAATCHMNRRSGELVALEPHQAPARPVLMTADR